MEQLVNKVEDVALIFEGGGMRNSYSSGAVNVLLENGIRFGAVYGVSAGASNAVNYLSQDLERSRKSFTENADDLPFRGIVSLPMKGGFFSPLLVRQSMKSLGALPFDFEAFRNNPAQLTLEGINRDTGATTYWTREDMATERDLMLRVSASTSYPLIMPPTRLEDGGFYYDGGPGEGGGIMVARARRDGFRRFFVVCTQPKGFRKPTKPRRIYQLFFWRRPHMRDAFASWGRRYNESLEELARLEADGSAHVFYAEDQLVTNHELNSRLLKENYRRGYAQAQRELPAWEAFLGQ